MASAASASSRRVISSARGSNVDSTSSWVRAGELSYHATVARSIGSETRHGRLSIKGGDGGPVTLVMVHVTTARHKIVGCCTYTHNLCQCCSQNRERSDTYYKSVAVTTVYGVLRIASDTHAEIEVPNGGPCTRVLQETMAGTTKTKVRASQ